jgi:integrase/recombinase XerD
MAPADSRLDALAKEHIRWLEVRGYARATLQGRRSNLRWFCRWAQARGVTLAEEVTLPVLERYQEALFLARKKDGGPLGTSTQIQRLVAVRRFLHWLHRMRYVAHDPATSMELPRRTRRIPRTVLTAAEAEAVLDLPDPDHPLGLRDRAILELLYSSGPRRTELSRLSLTDLDRARGVLLIREGKGRRDRMIPVSLRAIRWIEAYLLEARPRLATGPDPGHLFLSRLGGPLQPKRLSGLVSQYVEAAKLGKSGSCHLFRHTLATLMLEGGANLRHVQEMLGHADLRSTEIYTHVSLGKLQEAHRRCHPAAGSFQGLDTGGPG